MKLFRSEVGEDGLGGFELVGWDLDGGCVVGRVAVAVPGTADEGFDAGLFQSEHDAVGLARVAEGDEVNFPGVFDGVVWDFAGWGRRGRGAQVEFALADFVAKDGAGDFGELVFSGVEFAEFEVAHGCIGSHEVVLFAVGLHSRIYTWFWVGKMSGEATARGPSLRSG